MASTVSSLEVVLTASTGHLTRGLAGASRGIEGFVADVGRGTARLGAALTAGISLPLIGIGAAAAGLSIEWESAFAGVIKTVDGTEAQLSLLEDQIRGMATDATNPVSGLENAAVTLAGIAESAGQLGVARDDIAAFTETIGMLTMTTNLGAEDAATMSAQFQNLTQMDGSNIDNFASSLVALGNAGASTEADILQTSIRLAAAGTAAGLAEPEILAISSALASIGMNPEASGTSFSTVINSIAKAAATGNADLSVFAATAGLTEDAFTGMFESDPAGAMLEFVEGLGQLNAGEQIQTLDALGLSGTYTSQALRGLAGNTDILASSLTIANTSWAENTALTAEAGARFATTESQLNLLNNNVKDVGVSLGQALLPAINDVVAGLVPFLQGLADTSPEVIQFAVLVGAAAIAVGPLTAVLGGLVTVAGAVATGIAAIGLPIVVVVGGIAALLTAGGRLDDLFEDMKTAVSGLGESLGEIGAGFQLILAGDGSGFEVLRDGLQGLGESLVSIPISLIENLAIAIGNLIGIDVEGGFAAFQDAMGMVPLIVEGIAGQVADAFNDVAVSIRTGVRDLKQEIALAAVQLAATGGAIGLDTGLGQAQGIELQTIDIAEKLEGNLREALATGGPIQVDIPGIDWIMSDENANSAAQMASLVSNLVDPALISDAIEQALVTDNQAALDLLMPLGIELGIDADSLIAQFQAGVALAAAAGVTVSMPVNINAAVTVSGMPAELGANYSMSSNVAGSYATGTSWVPETAPYLLHEGETVLTRSQAQDYRSGGSGNTIVVNGVLDIERFMAEMRRRGIALATI